MKHRPKSVEPREEPVAREDTIGDCLSGADPLESLAERLALAMASAWERNQRPVVEDYLARHPEICTSPRAAARLLYEEFCLRGGLGEPAPSLDLKRRFPRWSGELDMLLECHELITRVDAPPALPEPGDFLGEFRCLAVLGRGLLGCVYLASQPALAGRQVVLKVTGRSGTEHLALARLQHANIVPLYAVHEFEDRDLRALCMPYLGRVTLAQALDEPTLGPLGARTGAQLLAIIDGARRAETSAPPPRGPAYHGIAGMDFCQAMCWIGATLADALHHAHLRGLIHLDLKPANVLLAEDGQPMLLDFHIAHAPIEPGGRPPKKLGGTPGFMAPEQELAIVAVASGRPILEPVDGRADIYALGGLLSMALGGEIPPPVGQLARVLPRANPQVGVALARILEKCLARDPRDRYADAAALAAELRRHLAGQPLPGVPRSGLVERLRKWRRGASSRRRIGRLASSLGPLLLVGLLTLDRPPSRPGRAVSSPVAGRRPRNGRQVEGEVPAPLADRNEAAPCDGISQ